jgi:hypothetical protein
MDRRTVRPRPADLHDPAGRRRRLPHPGLRGTLRRRGGNPDRPRVARGAGRRPRRRRRLRRHAASGPPRGCPAGDRRRQARAGGEAPGLDAAQAEEVAAAAGVFCMEAMWTLFLPRLDVVRQLLEQGLLGDVRTVLADHGERFDPPHRILDPAMAGGSLLDLGSYCSPGPRPRRSSRARRPSGAYVLSDYGRSPEENGPGGPTSVRHHRENGHRGPTSMRHHRENGAHGPTSVRQPAGHRLSQSDPPQVSDGGVSRAV